MLIIIPLQTSCISKRQRTGSPSLVCSCDTFFFPFPCHLGAKLLCNEWQLEDVLTGGRNSHQREVNVAQMTLYASVNFEACCLRQTFRTLFWDELAVLQKPTEARAAPNNCVFLPVPQGWLVSVVVYSINMSKDA